ncbi:MAG TPA: hypothetical protein VGI70_14375 [Polyangiales bacterium]
MDDAQRSELAQVGDRRVFDQQVAENLAAPGVMFGVVDDFNRPAGALARRFDASGLHRANRTGVYCERCERDQHLLPMKKHLNTSIFGSSALCAKRCAPQVKWSNRDGRLEIGG